MLLSKHYYSKVGELEEGGEEFLCAQTLDQMNEVEFWVRNLERQEIFSFWLQTSTDKFYPDFVCKLKDGGTWSSNTKGLTDGATTIRKKSAAWVNSGR